LWGPSVEDQRSGDVVSYLHHLGTARQKVQDPIAQGGVETQGLKLNDVLGSLTSLSKHFMMTEVSALRD
jgi:hypothetical protein